MGISAAFLADGPFAAMPADTPFAMPTARGAAAC
jgi:hypothetical protein